MFCLLCEDALRAQDEPLIHVIINLRNLPFFRLNLLTELTRIRNTCETVEKNKLMNIMNEFQPVNIIMFSPLKILHVKIFILKQFIKMQS